MLHHHLRIAIVPSKASSAVSLTNGWSASNKVVDLALERAFDIGVALTCLLLLLPLFTLVALAIRTVDRGLPFYSHRRVGRQKEPLDCLKFPSIRKDGDAVLKQYLAQNPTAKAKLLEAHKLKDDPRITESNHLLRKYSLDELRQLINVLRGEMIFIAPRSIMQAKIENYGDLASAYFAVRPGLTAA